MTEKRGNFLPYFEENRHIPNGNTQICTASINGVELGELDWLLGIGPRSYFRALHPQCCLSNPHPETPPSQPPSIPQGRALTNNTFQAQLTLLQNDFTLMTTMSKKLLVRVVLMSVVS